MPKVTERICEVSGCNDLGQHTGNYRKDGSIIRRAKCNMHHSIEYGLNGWDYKIYRKDYCENIDSRLGFKCTTTIIDYKYQCQVDHVDENHNNNNRKNLQTLCADCHAIKTKYFRTSDVKKLKFMNEQIIRSYNVSKD
jgi:5-methylcytosine-specific restriction endonuclease McrA